MITRRHCKAPALAPRVRQLEAHLQPKPGTVVNHAHSLLTASRRTGTSIKTASTT